MIGVLADDHLGEQTGPGQSLLDGLGEAVGDDDVGLAGLAGVFGSDMLDDDQAGGDVVELLADLLAEGLPAGTTIRAGELVGGDVVHDPPAFEVARAAACGRGPCAWASPWGRVSAAQSSAGPGWGSVARVASASARMSAAKSRSWSGSIFSLDRPNRWRSSRSS